MKNKGLEERPKAITTTLPKSLPLSRKPKGLEGHEVVRLYDMQGKEIGEGMINDNQWRQ